MKHVSRFFYRTGMLILSLLILLNLWLLIQTAVMKKAPPGIGTYAAVIVVSGSMEPQLSPGDVVIIHKQKAYELHQIITYRDHSALVTHRIVERTTEGFSTKGDANNAADQTIVRASDIMGAAVFVLPQVGSWLLFMKTPPGLFLMFAILCLLLAVAGRKETMEKRKRNV